MFMLKDKERKSLSCRKSSKFLTHLTPSTCLLLYNDVMTEYEKKEVHKYSKIYYVGRGAEKHIANQDTLTNLGYDEAENRYRLIQSDHIAYRYQINSLIGQGSYGCVINATDHASGKHVAVKIIRNETRFHMQANTEVDILTFISQEDSPGARHCIKLLECFSFRKHPCLVFPLYGPNLYQVLVKNELRGFTIDLVRVYSKSILECLVFLAKSKIIHNDIKPENIVVSLVNPRIIKVIDFGSSCFTNKIKTTYVQSRFYRSPEVLLENSYGTQIDMWSFGCILYEMAVGKPIFPGEDVKDQLACIMGALGLPPKSMLDKSPKKSVFFHSNGLPKYCNSHQSVNGEVTYEDSESTSGQFRHAPGTRDISESIPSKFNDSFYELLLSCLQLDPKTRCTPSTAVSCSWITKLDEDKVFLNNTSEGNSLSPNSENSELAGLGSNIPKKHYQHTISFTDNSTEGSQKIEVQNYNQSQDKVSESLTTILDRYGHEVLDNSNTAEVPVQRRISDYVASSKHPL